MPPDRSEEPASCSKSTPRRESPGPEFPISRPPLAYIMAKLLARGRDVRGWFFGFSDGWLLIASTGTP